VHFVHEHAETQCWFMVAWSEWKWKEVPEVFYVMQPDTNDIVES